MAWGLLSSGLGLEPYRCRGILAMPCGGFPSRTGQVCEEKRYSACTFRLLVRGDWRLPFEKVQNLPPTA